MCCAALHRLPPRDVPSALASSVRAAVPSRQISNHHFLQLVQRPAVLRESVGLGMAQVMPAAGLDLARTKALLRQPKMNPMGRLSSATLGSS